MGEEAAVPPFLTSNDHFAVHPPCAALVAPSTETTIAEQAFSVIAMGPDNIAVGCLRVHVYVGPCPAGDAADPGMSQVCGDAKQAGAVDWRSVELRCGASTGCEALTSSSLDMCLDENGTGTFAVRAPGPAFTGYVPVCVEAVTDPEAAQTESPILVPVYVQSNVDSGAGETL